MYENFTRIPPADQQRILNASIEEFAQHGYAQASTNTIVRQAGIPKGTLFFFFGSKKGLYLYALDQAIERYKSAFQEVAENPPADLFDRLLYHGRIRMEFAVREPQVYRLFYNAFVNAPDEIKAELQTRYAGYAAASMELVYKDLDRSPFRADVPVEKAVELVYLVLEGIYSRYLPRLQSLPPEQSLALIEQITGEVRQYFQMIQRGIYKQQEKSTT